MRREPLTMSVQTAETALSRLLTNRWLSIAVSVILIASALSEVIEDVGDFGSEHGVLVFGIFQLMTTLPEFFHAGQILEEASHE
jgi:hypothetical protein